MRSRVRVALALLGSSFSAAPVHAQPSAAPTRTYDVIVGAEAVDKMQVVRFGPGGASVLRERVIGKNAVDPDGPHGVGVSPDGRFLFLDLRDFERRTDMTDAELRQAAIDLLRAAPPEEPS